MLAFRDTDNNFELQESLLKVITNKNYNVDLAKYQDKKLIFDFAKEVYFDEKAFGNKSTRDKNLINQFKSPSIIVSASGVSSAQKRNLSQIQDGCHLILMNFVMD